MAAAVFQYGSNSFIHWFIHLEIFILVRVMVDQDGTVGWGWVCTMNGSNSEYYAHTHLCTHSHPWAKPGDNGESMWNSTLTVETVQINIENFKHSLSPDKFASTVNICIMSISSVFLTLMLSKALKHFS